MPAQPRCAARTRSASVLPLLGRQHLGGVGERLRQAPRRGLGELQLLGAQALERAAVDRRRGQQLDAALARARALLAQRQQVARRLPCTIGASFCCCSGVASIST